MSFTFGAAEEKKRREYKKRKLPSIVCEKSKEKLNKNV